MTKTHPPTPNASISSADRLCFTLFLAIALHVTLIIGIGFDIERNAPSSPAIEVTLTRTLSERAPDKADFIAQENQQGGGELPQPALPSTPQQSEHVSAHAPPAPASPPATASEQTSSERVLTAQRSQIQTTAAGARNTLTSKPAHEPRPTETTTRSANLVSPDIKQDVIEQLLSRDTRVLKVNSVAALKTSDAFYIKQWIDKIQRIGRRNYPSEALRRNIEGRLELTVVLLPDGRVKDIRVVRSSGHQILDDAAINIVRRAGRFVPFPEDMRKRYDSLEITRTWEFSKDGKIPLLTGQIH